MTAVVSLRPDPSTVPATMTDYQRTMADALAPITVPCPRCKSGRGLDCRSSGDYTVPFHAARKAAIAHLAEDERVAAFGALRAEQRRLRDELQALEAKRLADPVYVAEQERARQWWRDQFARLDEDRRAHERKRRTECLDQWVHGDDCMCADPTWVRPAPPVLDIGRREVTDLTQVRAARGRRRPFGGAA